MPIGKPLTEEQITFIRRNFATMRNQDIADALGISRSGVTNVQKIYHLRKSPEFASFLAVKAGKASNLARGGKALNITPEVIEKRVASYRRTLREERARVVFGLPQKTKANVKRQPRRKCSQRAYLKKLGYLLDEPNCVAYYTQDTTRAVRMERNWDGKRNYYKFRPIESNNDRAKHNL